MRFVAGRGTVAEVLLAGAPWRRHCWPCAVAERHREDAGRGAVAAEMLLAGRCWPGRSGGNGRDAVADVLLAGAQWRSAL